jgi:ABC-type polysaccharide/polyol phosphate transport system ATPase subunit
VVAVEVEGVSKRFRRQTIQPFTTVKTAVVDFILRRKYPGKDGAYQVLRDVNLTVRKGEVLGIIGRNGSGKSTLLKLLAGIYRPDCGTVSVQGKIGALLELGAGFHPEFSGRENIFLNGILLGLSKREIRQRFDAIVRFAELEAFIDVPVKNYSSGMYMRLGFSVAVHAEPDILFIDEILAVGDESFQQKCFDKVSEFRRQGKTIILVSHDLAAVQRWCDEVLWIDDGTVREQGLPRRVVDLYRQHIADQETEAAVAGHQGSEEALPQAPAMESSQRWGSREVEIVSVRMLDGTGGEGYRYHSGDAVRVLLRYKVQAPVSEAVFGIAILRSDGLRCFGSNTALEAAPLPPLANEGMVEVLLERLDLLDGSYSLDVAVESKDGYPYDYHHGLYPFTVKSELREVGVFHIPHCWVIRPLVTKS